MDLAIASSLGRDVVTGSVSKVTVADSIYGDGGGSGSWSAAGTGSDSGSVVGRGVISGPIAGDLSALL